MDKNRQQKVYLGDEVRQSSVNENAFESPHIYDVTPLLDVGEEHIGKHWSTDAGNECWNQKPLIKYLKYCPDCPQKLDHLYKRESYTCVKKTEKILRF